MKLYADTSRNDLMIVGISNEEEELLRDFVKKNDITYPIVRLKDLPAPYSEVQGIPTTFFVDRHGLIEKVAVGYHDFDALKAAATAADLPGPAKPAPTRSAA